MEVAEMYQLCHGREGEVPELAATRIYADPVRAIKAREQLTKSDNRLKGKVEPFKPSKRSRQFFLDQLVKFKAGIPDSMKYSRIETWSRENKRGGKLNLKSSKGTYIDCIEKENKRNPVPSVGKYHLENEDLSLRSRRAMSATKFTGFNSENRNFLDGIEEKGGRVPGPGQYNTNRTTFRFPKHNKIGNAIQTYQRSLQNLEQVKRRRAVSSKPRPEEGEQLEFPLPQSFRTFQSIRRESSKGSRSATRPASTSSRKKKEKALPGPADYASPSKWVRRSEKKRETPLYQLKTDIISKVSKGVVFSIYHS